jgi:hypothetical protein
VTDDGLELPVIDVTHPAFAFAISEAETNTLVENFVQALKRLANSPAGAMQALAQQSILVRGMAASANTYTTGIMTYLHKLEPENLGEGYAGPVDRQWAAGLTPTTFRWRMRDVIRLLVDGLVPGLTARPDGALHLLNIGGGPAADSLNALIVLHKEHPDLLAGRAVTIHVLDLDAEGPHFGCRALAALQAPGGPLHSVAADFVHHVYDWNDPAPLAALLDRIGGGDAVLALSSEGALFEYAPDDSIVANLATLREGTPADTVVVGPVVRDATTLDLRLKITEHVPGRPAIRYLGLAHFGALAQAAGWTIARHRDGPMHQVVKLAKG